MTKHERKEKAYATVKAFIRCYKDDLKYATYEGIGRNKAFIEGMIAGFNYVEIITDEERTDWLQEIYSDFSNMIYEKEIEDMKEKKQE
jgi:hypothetical protein